jgi:hypothetical protein
MDQRPETSDTTRGKKLAKPLEGIGLHNYLLNRIPIAQKTRTRIDK